MPVTVKNFIKTFTKFSQQSGFSISPIFTWRNWGSKKLSILFKATWQWVGPRHKSRSVWLQGPCSLYHVARLQQCEITDAAQIKITWSYGKKIGMGCARWVGQMLRLGRSMCTVWGNQDKQSKNVLMKKKSGALKMLKHFVWIESSFHCNEEQSETQWGNQERCWKLQRAWSQINPLSREWPLNGPHLNVTLQSINVSFASIFKLLVKMSHNYLKETWRRFSTLWLIQS